MKAVVYTAYGSPDVLQLRDVARPTPADDEVLIRIAAVSVNLSDWETLNGTPLYARIGGPIKPRRQILGPDIAGRIEVAGRHVQRFRSGDEVFGDILHRMGGFAEYVCARERSLAPKPVALTFEQAATIPQAGMIALQGIRDRGQVRPGHKVLINGAGGGAGSYAVQFAKLYGAEVTGVDNTEKLPFMRTLGADHVIDYTRQDFTRTGQQYDLILDMVAHRSVVAYARALKPGGRYRCVGGSIATFLQVMMLGPWIRRALSKSIGVLVVRPKLEDLLTMAALCEAGKVVPCIDRRYPLEEVPEALRYLGDGHVKGKLVISVSHEGGTHESSRGAVHDPRDAAAETGPDPL